MSKSRDLGNYGTAALADTQSSPTDTTAGALMAVGAGGLVTTDVGGVSFDDFNSQTSSGFSYRANTAANAPATGGPSLYTLEMASSSAGFFGTFALSTVGVPYFKGVAAGSWATGYTTANAVGTVVSDKSGAIIETGSNANGSYTKFADGTMICTFFSATVIAFVAEQNLTGWTFPATFIDAYYTAFATVLPMQTQNFYGHTYSQSEIAASVGFVFRNGATAQNIKNRRFLAIGRWF